MYGSLSEIDIPNLLELIERGQRTGQLLVEIPSSQQESTPSCDNPFWFLFFTKGQITYAVSNAHLHLQRLQDYLRRYQVESRLEALLETETSQFSATELHLTGRILPEYDYLWLLLEHKVLTASQGRQILSSMVHETLFDLVSLTQGHFVFQSNTIFQPELTQIEIYPLVKQVIRQLQQWKQLSPYIASPEQCPLLRETEQVQNALTSSAYRSLAVACQGQLSLRRLARYLNKDIVTLSQALYPYLQKGWLTLLNSQQPPEKTAAEKGTASTVFLSKVICVHELGKICDQIEYMLKEQGYRPIILNEPIEALSVIVQEQPNLVFCDLEMSALAGEQLGSLLRHLPSLAKLPIIFVTPDNPDPLRLAKARLLGGTAFLTPPLNSSNLSQVLKTYLGNNQTFATA
ncbi:MAG: response regulator [Cyanobacteria bacterium SW_9_44_58]|nr:MAG: response regulator [Cyanobacteria bacterium SW_9_44_58]